MARHLRTRTLALVTALALLFGLASRPALAETTAALPQKIRLMDLHLVAAGPGLVPPPPVADHHVGKIVGITLVATAAMIVTTALVADANRQVRSEGPPPAPTGSDVVGWLAVLAAIGAGI